MELQTVFGMFILIASLTSLVSLALQITVVYLLFVGIAE